MKKYILIILLFTVTTNAQISGRVFSDGYPDVVVQATILQTGETTEPDFDGCFSVHIPDKIGIYDLLIDAGQMDFKIENITQEFHQINLGDIEFPFLRTISIEQYNELQEIEKIKYVPIYHYANLLVYCDKLTLSSNYITFYCKGVKHQTNQFTFNPTEMLISIDAKNLIRCDN